MTYETDKAYRAGRSLLADHIKGARNTVRKQRAELASIRNEMGAMGQYGGVRGMRAARLEGSLNEALYNLQGLRYLSAEFRGR